MNFFATVNIVEVLAVLLGTVDTTHLLPKDLFLFFFNNLCSNMEAKVVACKEEDGGREDFNQQVIWEFKKGYLFVCQQDEVNKS